jgi:hypothetical protein
MTDADPAPAALPEANPDLASDAELATRAAALVVALRSGDSDAQTKAAEEISSLVAALKDPEPPQPANPRTTAALVAAGVGAALLPLVQHASEVGVSAGYALRELLYHSDSERKAVVENLGVNKLLQLLHESKDELQRNALAPILYEFAWCNEWMESLSPDSDIVSRIFSLPFLSTANAYATGRALGAAERMLHQHPSFRRALASHTSLLAGFLVGGFLELCGSDDDRIKLTEFTCRLLHMLQDQDDFDVLAFEEARVHIACVELLGQLCRSSVTLSSESYAGPTRVLAASFNKSRALRQRISNLIFACPGALAGVVTGVGNACVQGFADADALVSFLDGLRRSTPGSAESFLVDTQFAACVLLYHAANELCPPAYLQLHDALIAAWKTPDCLRAMRQPLPHQKLAVAVSLASLTEDGSEFRRVIVADDHLEVLAHALVDSAGSPRLGTALTGDFQAWREEALRRALDWLLEDLQWYDTAADGDDATADETPAKRARIFSAITLRACDVNVQRRDSTVLLIAGRPFYVFGALIETKSAVLADALSSATTLDPVAVALSNEVPDEQQYALFHAAVEHTYTGTVADVAAESLLPLWCIGDHLHMDELCAWCAERLVPVLAKDATLLERTWATALARPSDALGDACAVAWLLLEKSILDTDDISSMLLLKRVHESCAAKELIATQLARVMRKALLPTIG